MTTDFNGREPDITPNDGGSMFANKPIWEQRAKKRRGGFGGGRKASADAPAPTPEPRAPDTRSFAPPEAATAQPDLTLDRPMTSTVTPSTFAARETVGDAPMGAPMAAPIRTARAKPKSNASPAILAGAVAAVALIGVGGWYLSRPHDGVPTLAPGQPTTSEVAAAPILPAAEQPSEVSTASNTLPARPATTSAPARPERMASAARVRPAARAAAPSAATTGTNASAVLPDGPQPYSAVNPAAAPTQVTPPAPPPAEAAPPAAIPSTPPVQTPQQSAPPPTEATPVTPPQ